MSVSTKGLSLVEKNLNNILPNKTYGIFLQCLSHERYIGDKKCKNQICNFTNTSQKKVNNFTYSIKHRMFQISINSILCKQYAKAKSERNMKQNNQVYT
jgi:hypothetical protein